MQDASRKCCLPHSKWFNWPITLVFRKNSQTNVDLQVSGTSPHVSATAATANQIGFWIYYRVGGHEDGAAFLALSRTVQQFGAVLRGAGVRELVYQCVTSRLDCY